MRWQVKCLEDNLKALVPFQDRLRGMKRSLCGFRPDAGKDRWTIQQGLWQLRAVRAALDRTPGGFQSATIVEVGSGWQPLIPLLYSLAGARQVIMTDLNRLMHVSSFAAAVDSLRVNRNLLLDEIHLDEPSLEDRLRWDSAESLERTLECFRLRYMAPCDVRKTALPAASVDAVVSRAVLEHIPREIVAAIFAEAARIVRPGGVMCHIIDNSDHWQHVDSTITRVNFLRYSDHAFRWTHLHGLNYQNRLRHSEYASLLREAGFEIEEEERTIDAESTRALESLPVAPRFRRFSKEDLATITSHFLARKTGVQPAGG